jgi:hypothetical protein
MSLYPRLYSDDTPPKRKSESILIKDRMSIYRGGSPHYYLALYFPQRQSNARGSNSHINLL